MKKVPEFLFISCLTAFFILLIHPVYSQKTYTLTDDFKTVVIGTSTLKDWTVEVLEMEGTIWIADSMFMQDIPYFNTVNLKFKVESMESHRGSIMNQKTYKALRYEENPYMSFISNSIKMMKSNSPDECEVLSSGIVNIAGVERDIDIMLKGNVTENGVLHFTGTKDIKMSDFNVEKPSAMFGQIVCHDDLELTFEMKFAPPQK